MASCCQAVTVLDDSTTELEFEVRLSKLDSAAYAWRPLVTISACTNVLVGVLWTLRW